MKRNLLNIIGLIILFAPACTRESEIKPTGERDLWVVLGEICADEPIGIHLYSAKNISSTPASQQSLIEASVQLFDVQHKLLSTLRQSSANQWSSAFTPQANQSYRIEVSSSKKKVEITTMIPQSFSARIVQKTSYDDALFQVTLQIDNPTESAAEYVIEYLQIQPSGDLRLHYLESSDKQTDNYIYNELESPYNRIFVRTQKNSTSVTMRIAKPNHSEKYILRVKSVEAPYYRYLYQYEAQKDNESAFLDSPSNNAGYLGICGGTYRRDIKIELE